MRTSTKIFSRKNKLLAIFIAILFFALLNVFQKEVRNFCYVLFSPAQKILWQVGNKTTEFWETIIEAGTVQEDKEKLERRNLELLAENTELKELKSENDFLRAALNLGLEKDFQLILAQVIAKDISEDSILIDKGSESGILQGSSVVTEEKILLGKVEEVHQNFSKIMLISNKNSSFNARLDTDQENDVAGIIEGKGNCELLLDFVPREKEIKKDDILVTTAWGGIFPKGLLVGRVKEIKKNDVDPFQKLEITPFFNIEKMRMLFVIIEKND